jgi:hypothetical protein
LPAPGSAGPSALQRKATDAATHGQPT